MIKLSRFLGLTVTLCISFLSLSFAAEVIQVAPNVYFRVADQGCNNGWVVFRDYVLVIDANFPDEAERVIADIKQTTDKPIRYVINTHFHGDHSLGNAVFAAEGAAVIAQQKTLQNVNATQSSYQQWTRQHEKYQHMPFTQASQYFDQQLIFDDGEMRVELQHYGHAHTPVDTIVYLPKQKILFSGDVCVNGAYNYMGQMNLEGWIDTLSILQDLEIDTLCPGHGRIATKDLLQTQRNYFLALQSEVHKGINANLPLSDIIPAVTIPFYKEWTGVEPRESNIRTMFNYLTGLMMPPTLTELGLQAGPSPTKDTPGWTPPRKILTRNMSDDQIKMLQSVAPEITFMNVRDTAQLNQEILDADAALFNVNTRQIQQAKNLRWVHSVSAGVEHYMDPAFVEHPFILTNGQGKSGPSISDTVIGYMLLFARGLGEQIKIQQTGRWSAVRDYPFQVLHNKTILVLGLGGIGHQIAQKAAGLGMKVYAIDPSPIEKPFYVRKIAHPDEIETYLPLADFVASSVPLTQYTNRYFGKKYFDLMQPTAYFINIGRGRTVHQDDLIAALQNNIIAGAALDVTDPEPLPQDSPLWKMPNVIITPHMSGRSPNGNMLSWYIIRENVRRFANGEPLLNVVNKQKGY